MGIRDYTHSASSEQGGAASGQGDSGHFPRGGGHWMKALKS